MIIIGKYKIEKCINKNGLVDIYLSRKNKSNILYSTIGIDIEKLNNNIIIKHITKKINLIKSINHKNILKFENLFSTQNRLYIFTEYSNGNSLIENIIKYKNKYGKPFPEKISQYIIKQLFDIFNYLNERQNFDFDFSVGNLILNFWTDEAKDTQDILNSDLKFDFFGKIKEIKDESLLNKLNNDNYKLNYFYILDIFSICYILLTGDLSFKINYELDLKQFEIKIPINLSLDSIILLVYLFQCYIDKKINVKELLNQPFLSKYYADFTDLDIKSVSEYIKDEYLVINISNNNEIYPIITKQNIK